MRAISKTRQCFALCGNVSAFKSRARSFEADDNQHSRVYRARRRDFFWTKRVEMISRGYLRYPSGAVRRLAAADILSREDIGVIVGRNHKSADLSRVENAAARPCVTTLSASVSARSTSAISVSVALLQRGIDRSAING